MAGGYLFVYGTLMSGFENHRRYLEGHVLSRERATLPGELYHLRYGYPALAPGNASVTGELLLVKDLPSLLPLLDDLEDYHGPGQDNLYERVEVEATTVMGQKVKALTYRYARLEELAKIGVKVKGGDWKDFLQRPKGNQRE